MSEKLLENGRQGAPESGEYQNTIARKSAEQGLLLQNDILIDALIAIRDGADLAAIQTALGGLSLEKLKLRQ